MFYSRIFDRLNPRTGLIPHNHLFMIHWLLSVRTKHFFNISSNSEAFACSILQPHTSVSSAVKGFIAPVFLHHFLYNWCLCLTMNHTSLAVCIDLIFTWYSEAHASEFQENMRSMLGCLILIRSLMIQCLTMWCLWLDSDYLHMVDAHVK